MISDMCIVGDTVIRAEKLAEFLGFACHTHSYDSPIVIPRLWRRILVLQPHGRIMTEDEHKRVRDRFISRLAMDGKVHWI
jgi:hypothetical protein